MNRVQYIFGVYDPVSGKLIGVTPSGNTPPAAVLGSASIVSTFAALRLQLATTVQTVFATGKTAQADGGGGTFVFNPADTSSGAFGTGSVTGSVFICTSIVNGAFAVGQSLNRGDTGASVATITSLGTGTGGIGTYNLSAPASIAGPIIFTGDSNSNVIVGTDGSRWNLASQVSTSVGAGIYGTDSGVLNAYVFTHSATDPPATLTVGCMIRFTPLSNNTLACTVNADGTGAIAVVKQNGFACTGGEFSFAGETVLQYNGTNWQIVVTAGAQPGYERTPSEVNTGNIPADYRYPPFNMLRFGVNGNGVFDNGPAIRAMIAVAKDAGGARIVFPSGPGGGALANYLISSLDPASPISIPQQNTNGSITYGNTSVAVYCKGLTNVTFDFSSGSTIATTGGYVETFLFDNCSDIRFIQPRFTGAQVFSGGVTTLGAITGGTLYTNGQYNNVPLTGGSGSGAYANITVAGGSVTAVNIVYPGGSNNGGAGAGYATTDTLSAAAASIGGTGSGFSVPVTSVTGTGGVPTTNGAIAIGITMVSGPSTRFEVQDLDAVGMNVGVYAVGDPGIPANTVTQVNVTGYTRVSGCQYGVAFHNAGDNSTIQNLYAFRCGRPFFFYGVQNVNVNCISEQNNRAIYALVKAYSRTTRFINIRYELINTPGLDPTSPTMSFQIQGDPAVVPIPPVLDTVFLDYHENNASSGGNGIRFDYFAGSGGTVQTGTSANPLFNNFWVRGKTLNQISQTVVLGIAAQCQINYDGLTYSRPPAANDLNNSSGFVVSYKFTYVPSLLFGGGNTGMTFSTQAADYYIAGGFCTVIGRFTITAKGTSTGAAQIALPFNTRSDSVLLPTGTAYIASGGAGLSAAPIIAFVSAGGSALNLAQQGAAAITNLADTNFTNTTDLRFQVSYPL